MNKDTFEQKWKQIREHSPAWWTLIAEFDLKKLDKAPDKFDRYTSMLQVKYGYTRVQAKAEIARRVGDLEALNLATSEKK